MKGSVKRLLKEKASRSEAPHDHPSAACNDYFPLGNKRMRVLHEVDRLPAELRVCVHEYGAPIVAAFAKHGIYSPAAIHEIVREIWEGPRETAQNRPKLGSLDWLLVQSGSGLSAATLARILANNSMAVVPFEATRAMLDASMREVATFDQRVTKEEKHRRRLRAAIKAGALK